MSKKFVCECGKEFENPQSFNGHKSHCKIHMLEKYGNLDTLKAQDNKRGNGISKYYDETKEKRKKEKEEQ